MSRHPEILEACQDHGLILGRTLIEYPGWRTRGSENFTPKGSVNHHTAGPRTGDLPSLPTLINGRSDLPGPLCNAALSRSGNIHLIAAGRANHAGLGGFRGLTGNSSVWGLEIEHCGLPDEAVSAKQWDSIYRWHAACMDVSKQMDASLVCQHFEWAPERKIDFVKVLIAGQGGVEGFRAKVLDKMNKEEDDMATAPYSLWQFKGDSKVWRVEDSGQSKVHVSNPPALAFDQAMLALGGFNNTIHITGAPDDSKDSSYEWLASVPVEGAIHDAALVKAIVEGVIKALPPASTGGLTEQQVQDACAAAIEASGILAVLPGK